MEDKKKNKTFETNHELVNTKETVKSNISKRHQETSSIMKNAYRNIMEDFVESFEIDTTSEMDDDRDIALNQKIDKASSDLDDLLSGLI